MRIIRQAKISTILASGDKNIDLISVNDEMISEFKHKGYLEPLEKNVMTEEVRDSFPQKYLESICEAEWTYIFCPFSDGYYDVLGKSGVAETGRTR